MLLEQNSEISSGLPYSWGGLLIRMEIFLVLKKSFKGYSKIKRVQLRKQFLLLCNPDSRHHLTWLRKNS